MTTQTPDPEKLADNDFLAMEPLLVQIVRDAVAGQVPAVHVLTEADLKGVEEAKQFTPAVHVLYGGFTVADVRSDGRAAILRHTWLVVAVARSASGTRSGAQARADAGKLLARAGGALCGKRLPRANGAVVPVNGPKDWASTGFKYMPMAFAVETFFHAI